MRVAPLASTAVPAPTHREPSPAPAASSPSCVAFTIDAIASSHDALISAPHAPPSAGRSTTASRGAGSTSPTHAITPSISPAGMLLRSGDVRASSRAALLSPGSWRSDPLASPARIFASAAVIACWIGAP